MDHMDVEATPNQQQQQKKTLERRKIEIKKVESRRARYVHFSKRRASLFKKASDLSILCGAEIALAVLSCGGKVITFGDLDAVAARYLDQIDRAVEEEEEADGATTQLQHQEKKGGFWWESIEIEGKSIEELKELASMLATEKEELVRRLAEFIFPNPTRDIAAVADVAVRPVSEQWAVNMERQQYAGGFL